MKRRVVVKTGSNLLTAGTDRLDPVAMGSLADQLAYLHRDGHQVALVSSGAIAAGRAALAASHDPAPIAQRQVLAAVGQSRLMAAWGGLFEAHGILAGQILVTRGDIDHRLSYLNARDTVHGLFEQRVLPIINENDVVAVDEITGTRFGDNDQLSALVAGMIDADILIILTDQPGLFTADPATDPDARLIDLVPRIDASVLAMAGGSTSGRGMGGMATKLLAAQHATAAGIDVIITSGHRPDVLLAALAGQPGGTRFPATVSRLEARKRWLLSGLGSRGALRLDPGAAAALLHHARSLLAAGITGIEGSFERGDTVRIVDATGTLLAYGQVAYPAADLDRIRGRRSAEIAGILGYAHGDAIVHRNDLVLAATIATPDQPRGDIDA